MTLLFIGRIPNAPPILIVIRRVLVKPSLKYGSLLLCSRMHRCALLNIGKSKRKQTCALQTLQPCAIINQRSSASLYGID